MPVFLVMSEKIVVDMVFTYRYGIHAAIGVVYAHIPYSFASILVKAVYIHAKVKTMVGR